eukprot:COSAG01_NODE_41130_length_455_cov_1.294944_1_plen_45_part_10
MHAACQAGPASQAGVFHADWSTPWHAKSWNLCGTGYMTSPLLAAA